LLVGACFIMFFGVSELLWPSLWPSLGAFFGYFLGAFFGYFLGAFFDHFLVDFMTFAATWTSSRVCDDLWLFLVDFMLEVAPFTERPFSATLSWILGFVRRVRPVIRLYVQFERSLLRRDSGCRLTRH